MSEIVELETERLILKGVNPEVIKHFFKTKTKKEILDFFGFDEAGYDHMENMYDKGMETHSISLFHFVLVDKKSNSSIGACGFHTWNKKHRRTEVFYNMHSDDNKGKGYMTEALKAMLAFGFTKLDLHRVVGMVADWNTPSVRLLLGNGFMKEGTAREDYNVNGVNESSDCYSLLKWEWEKKNHRS